MSSNDSNQSDSDSAGSVDLVEIAARQNQQQKDNSNSASLSSDDGVDSKRERNGRKSGPSAGNDDEDTSASQMEIQKAAM